MRSTAEDHPSGRHDTHRGRALFWAAILVSNTLGTSMGATAGDFLTKPVAKGGLALGTIGSSIVLLALLLGLMAHAHRQERKN